jgi:hypothetical protein
MVVKYKFTNIAYFHVVWKILHVPVVGRFSYLYGAYAWFLCYFSGLISTVRAVSGCRACISFMLPVVLFCYRVGLCLFGMVPCWVQVQIRQCFILQWFQSVSCGISPDALIYVNVGTCSAVSCVLCAAGVFVPSSDWGHCATNRKVARSIP